MKWILLILVVLALPLVSALEMCEDYIDLDSSCQMTSPPITCTTYNYSVTKENGSVVEVGNLTNLVNNIYYFNFSHVEGDYVISLCTGLVSREVYVQGDDSMSWTAISLLMLGIASLFLFAGFNIKAVEFRNLRVLLFLVGILNTILLFLLPVAISLNPSAPSAWLPVAIAYLSTHGLLLLYIVWRFGTSLIMNMWQFNKNKKDDN